MSVAFWRWSIWKLFEAPNAPRRGVIALITNRKFLTGWPYAGLRKMLRERFDRIEIIDLRGDVRLGSRAGGFGNLAVLRRAAPSAIGAADFAGWEARFMRLCALLPGAKAQKARADFDAEVARLTAAADNDARQK